MKYIKLLTVSAILSFSLLAVLYPGQSFALTKAEQTACFKKWDGNNSPVNGYPSGYLASKCDTTKGGNCKKVTSVEGGKTNAALTCVNPSASNSSTVGAIPDKQDPALGVCKAAADCNLVKNYVNPFINKFLAPLAMLAVVIGIIWGAIELISSSGDPQRAASGKGHIQKALIGLVSFMFLYAMLNWLIPGGIAP